MLPRRWHLASSSTRRFCWRRDPYSPSPIGRTAAYEQGAASPGATDDLRLSAIIGMPVEVNVMTTQLAQRRAIVARGRGIRDAPARFPRTLSLLGHEVLRRQARTSPLGPGALVVATGFGASAEQRTLIGWLPDRTLSMSARWPPHLSYRWPLGRAAGRSPPDAFSRASKGVSWS